MKNLISILEVLVISGCFVGFFNSKSVAAEPEKTNLSQPESQIESQTDTEPIYPEGLISIPEDPRFSKYVFVVGKKERTLWIYERDGEKLKVIEKFETDMGKNDGEKTKANDRKTPIGIYFLQSRLAPPEIPYKLYGSQAFTTDYPNVFDKRDARTGSGIWLHAVPNSVPLTRGSRGCVVVRDEVIKKLGQYIHLKQTPLVIYKEINFLTFQQHQQNKKRFLDFFEKWRSSWESEDIDSYIRFYDDSFRNDKMDLNAWIRHKKKMRGLYSAIKVDLSIPLIISNKDQVVMRTNQRYKSNLHEDFGEKTIHARGSPQDGLFGFKIIREDWRPIAENQP